MIFHLIFIALAIDILNGRFVPIISLGTSDKRLLNFGFRELHFDFKGDGIDCIGTGTNPLVFAHVANDIEQLLLFAGGAGYSKLRFYPINRIVVTIISTREKFIIRITFHKDNINSTHRRYRRRYIIFSKRPITNPLGGIFCSFIPYVNRGLEFTLFVKGQFAKVFVSNFLCCRNDVVTHAIIISSSIAPFMDVVAIIVKTNFSIFIFCSNADIIIIFRE